MNRMMDYHDEIAELVRQDLSNVRYGGAPDFEQLYNIYLTESYAGIRIYSAQFKGELPAHSSDVNLQTEACDSFDEAVQRLQMLAAANGCFCIVQASIVPSVILRPKPHTPGQCKVTQFTFIGVGLII